MFRTRDLIQAIDASGQDKIQQALWRARLLDPDQAFFDDFSQPPQVLYKYLPADRLDHALPDQKPCAFRATPPNELNDINEVNFRTSFVDDEANRETINQAYAATLTRLFPKSPISVDDVEEARRTNPHGYGAELAREQLSRRYGVTAFSTRRDDVNMWSHYADDCRGVVVGYNVDRWVKHLLGTSIIRQVRYEDEFPMVMGPQVVNQENAYAFMSSKGPSWASEHEWRLITELSKTRLSINSMAFITVPQDSVSSVLVTNRTPRETIRLVVARLNNPSNHYRLSWVDKLARGRDPTTLAFTGQMKTRAPQPAPRHGARPQP